MKGTREQIVIKLVLIQLGDMVVLTHATAMGIVVILNLVNAFVRQHQLVHIVKM